MRNVWAVLLLSVVATGCGRDRAPVATAPAPAPEMHRVAQVTVRMPGAPAGMVDRHIASAFLQNARAIPGVRSITCVSGEGLFEGYVAATSADEAQLSRHVRAALAANELPADACTPVVAPADRLPFVDPTAKPEIHVALDRDKLAALGLTAGEVTGRLTELLSEMAAGERSAEDLAAATVTTRDGRSVRLGDVASFRYVKQPDRIVRRYPPAQPSSAPPSPPPAAPPAEEDGAARPAPAGAPERLAEQSGGQSIPVESIEALRRRIPTRPGKRPVAIIIDDSMSTERQ
jgi:multidrug efflux pump subunit AcrB